MHTSATSVRKILVGTDFSPRADRALRRASLLARSHGATLSLVHVLARNGPPRRAAARAAHARTLIERAARTLRDHDGIATEATIAAGPAEDAILAEAEAGDADLIVLGPHRRRLGDIVVDCLAGRIAARSPKPLLVAAGPPAGPYDRALIALGLDAPSRAAATRVRRLGLLASLKTIALHAFDAPAQGVMRRSLLPGEMTEAYVTGERRRAATRFAAFLAELGLGRAQQAVAPVRGSLARTILEQAREDGSSLVIVGTSRRRGLPRLLIGSTAQDLIAASDRDILVIP